MYESAQANTLSVLRHDASMRFGRCDIIVALTKEQMEYAKDVVGQDGYMILNVGYNAVRDYVADENGIGFECRIKGVVRHFWFDYKQIIGVRDSELISENPELVAVVPIFQFAFNLEKQREFLIELHKSRNSSEEEAIALVKEKQANRPNHLRLVK